MMSKRVTINQRTDTPVAGRGSFTTTWAMYTQAWAYFDSWKARKNFKDQQLTQTMAMRCVIRYQIGITSKMSLEYNGRNFNIEGPYDVDEKHEYLEMYLTEGAAQ